MQNSDQGPSFPDDAASSQANAREAKSRPMNRTSSLAATLVAGLIAGAVGGIAGETIYSSVNVPTVLPPDFSSMGAYQKNAVQAMAEGEAIRTSERRKAAMTFGLLGAVLGLGVGLAGGLVTHSHRSGLVGAITGLVVGLLAGASLSFVLVPVFFKYQDPEAGMLLIFLVHSGIFAGIGLAAGIAYGVGRGGGSNLQRGLLGGLIGGIAGTFAYESIMSLAFPLLRTFEPIATEPGPRIAAHGCVAIATALALGLTASGEPRKRRI